MSNTRHTNGSVPLVAPPSAEVAGQGLAMLGRLIATDLAAMLGELLPRMPWQPDCEPCVVSAARAVRAYEVLCANALAAGEDAPAAPEPPRVGQACTWQDGRPVCFAHVSTSVTPQP